MKVIALTPFPQVRYIFPLEGMQWLAPFHGYVRAVTGQETQNYCSGRDVSSGISGGVTGNRLPLYTVSYFKYLVRLITVVDDDWVALILNLNQVWKRWARIPLIL